MVGVLVRETDYVSKRPFNHPVQPDASELIQKAKAEEYLIALYLLARCNCLIGGRTSGIVVSYLLADHLEDFFVWNKGKYGIDHEEMVEGHIF